MHLSGFDLVNWLASFLGNLVLLAVLFAKRRFLAFPVFTSWIALSVFRTVTLFFVRPMGGSPYFYAFWAFAFVDLSLQLVVFYEAAVHVFRPGPMWAPDVRRAFAWIVSLGLLIGIGMTWLGVPATGQLRGTIVIRADFLSSVLMSELFIGMLALSYKLGLPWKTHVARIVQGLGVYSMIGIVSGCLQTYVGFANDHAAYNAIFRCRVVGFLICQWFWIVSLYMKAPEPKSLPAEMHRQLVLVQQRASLVLGRLSGSGQA